MQLAELQQHIIKNNLSKFYIFSGDEVGIMDIYMNKMVDVSGAEKVRVDTVAEAWAKIQKKRISGTPKFYIIRDDKEFIKEDKLQDRVVLESSRYPDYILLICTSVDSRTKFAKRFQNDMIQFSKLGVAMLEKYIEKELPGISKQDSQLLAEVCDCDYNRILLECDKIRNYSLAIDNGSSGRKEIGMPYGKALRYLVDRGVIYKPIGDITFKFTDAVLVRNTKAAADYLIQARTKGESEILILSTLYNGFKHILMVQGLGPDKKDATKRTGLTAWQVKMAMDKLNHYELGELVNILQIVRETEKGIKTGGIDANIAIEYVLVNIM